MTDVAMHVCVYDICRLLYNSTTNNYSAEEGVTVSVPGFGRTDTVEHLNTNTLDPIDPSHLLEYQHTFVEYFVQRGYVRGKSIRAAPYDWRLAAGKPASHMITSISALYKYYLFIYIRTTSAKGILRQLDLSHRNNVQREQQLKSYTYCA